MNENLEKTWTRIEEWNALHFDPELGSYLQPPASEEAITFLNKQLGSILPLDFLDSLRRHDGTENWSTEFHKGRLLSTSEVLAVLNMRRDIVRDLYAANQHNRANVDARLTPSGPVKNVFWSNNWIPIQATDWSLSCFDFDPAEGGTIGQVIEVDWEGGLVKVIANNYVDFLCMCADELPEEPLE